jgi:hypothetical protein
VGAISALLIRQAEDTSPYSSKPCGFEVTLEKSSVGKFSRFYIYFIVALYNITNHFSKVKNFIVNLPISYIELADCCSSQYSIDIRHYSIGII